MKQLGSMQFSLVLNS